MARSEVLGAIDACCDDLPRKHAQVEELGPLRLFVGRDGAAYYARPAASRAAVGADDVRATRLRQRQLGVPESFEWIDDLMPTLSDAALAAGLEVRHCPLLIFDPLATPTSQTSPDDAEVLAWDSPDLAQARAVAEIAFRHSMSFSCIARDALVQRDAVAGTYTPDRLAPSRQAIRTGDTICATAHPTGAGARDGPVATGGIRHARSIAEVVGVATLPAFRRRGLAGAVTACLTRHALAQGMRMVFLSAQDERAARVYERVGFRRVGTAGIAAPPES
jgi:ribosomal protein S18 acetylase RimI-like enzyme